MNDSKQIKLARRGICNLLRWAITCRTKGPPLFESMEILGKEETLKRIDALLQTGGGAES